VAVVVAVPAAQDLQADLVLLFYQCPLPIIQAQQQVHPQLQLVDQIQLLNLPALAVILHKEQNK
jgi:hypothetical protein